MKSLNIAVVGFGLIGQRHCEIINNQKNINLSAIVENNLEKNFSNFNCKNYSSIKSMLSEHKPDGAIIASPSNMHVDHALELIENDIPVLIEKPISHSLDNVEKLIKLAKNKSIPILVGHHRRYNEIITSAKKILDEGLIGNIRSAMSMCWFYKPDNYFDIAPWRKKLGAGPISINLIHDLDLLRYFCGEIESVQASIKKSVRGFENEDNASILLNFKSGVIATMNISDSIVSPWSWEMNSNENSDFPQTGQNCYFIGGSKGSLSIPDLKIWKHENKPDWLTQFKTEKHDFKNNQPLETQLQHFAKVIQKIEEPRVSAEEGYKSLQAIESIKASSEQKKIIFL